MRWRILLVLLITVLSFLWVLSRIEPGRLQVSAQTYRWSWMSGVFALYLASHAVRVVRFRWILGRPVPFWRLMSITSIGYFAINVVPARLGELVRPYLLAEREQVPFGEGMAAIFVERLVDMVMLLGMLFAVTWLVELPPGALVVQGIDLIATGQRVVGGLVVAGIVGLVLFVTAGERALVWSDKLPLGSVVRRFVVGLRGLFGRPREIGGILLASLLIWLFTFWSVQLSLAAYPGLPATLSDSLVVWTGTLLAMALVPTAAFVGSFEAGAMGGVMALGGNEQDAVAFALILHLGQFFFTIGWGGLFILWEGMSLREVVARSQRAAERS